MQIDLQTRDIVLTEEISNFVSRRLKFSFGSREEYILRIQVRISDINGPRGGVDKRCQIRVVLPKIADVVVTHTEDDVYIAVDRAAERASYAVNRTLARYFNRHRAFGRLKHRIPIARINQLLTT